jgi:hypothetical protein
VSVNEASDGAPTVPNVQNDWKVIEVISGQIAAYSGADALEHTRQHEHVIWQGAADGANDALRQASNADRRVDLKYMRIRHEMELELFN